MIEPAGQVSAKIVEALPVLSFQKATWVTRGGRSQITSETVTPVGMAVDLDSSRVMPPSSVQRTSAFWTAPAVVEPGQMVIEWSLKELATEVMVEFATVQMPPMAAMSVPFVTFVEAAAEVAVKRKIECAVTTVSIVGGTLGARCERPPGLPRLLRRMEMVRRFSKEGAEVLTSALSSRLGAGILT
jgi:hypothetical protein